MSVSSRTVWDSCSWFQCFEPLWWEINCLAGKFGAAEWRLCDTQRGIDKEPRTNLELELKRGGALLTTIQSSG